MFAFVLLVHVYVHLKAYEWTHHIGLPGLLYVMRSDDDRNFSRLYNLHQMLPDPVMNTKETKHVM